MDLIQIVAQDLIQMVAVDQDLIHNVVWPDSPPLSRRGLWSRRPRCQPRCSHLKTSPDNLSTDWVWFDGPECLDVTILGPLAPG